MDESYIAKRITQLRMARNISEYQMSLELGHSKSYIQSITSGKSMPSTQELFNIADYSLVSSCTVSLTSSREITEAFPPLLSRQYTLKICGPLSVFTTRRS